MKSNKPKTLSKYEVYKKADLRIFKYENVGDSPVKNDQQENEKAIESDDQKKDEEGVEKKDSKNQLIEEANKILKERTKNRGLSLTTRPKGKHAFITDTKEVSLKNYLIDQLKHERTKLNDKEITIGQDLKSSDLKLIQDEAQFNYFVENEKEQMKRNEGSLLHETHNKKLLIDQKNELIKDRKQILDEIERNIKNINNLKTISLFVHKLMGIKTSRENLNSSSNEDSKRNAEESMKLLSSSADKRSSKYVETKESIIEKFTEDIINEFKIIGNKSKQTKEILSDYKRLVSKFNETEEKILKLMEKKEETEKEITKIRERHEIELEQLKEQEKAVLLEKKKLEEEYRKDERALVMLKNQINDGGEDTKNQLLLRELYKDTFRENPKQKKLIEELIRQLMEHLKQKENQIRDYIYQLELYPKAHVENQVEKRKEKNKETTRKEIQEKNKVESEIKNQRARERMNRIVIKGRNVMNHFKPKEGIKKISQSEQKNYNENNILYYDSGLD